jgi:membrane protein YqaA with SNARE-associated domain
MKIFGPLYDKVLEWSRHRHAERYLAVISFAESSFFPVPTAFMLAPMVLANRERAWWLAILATLTSVAGGVLGYAIGYFVFDQVGMLIIDSFGKQEAFQVVKERFLKDGVWLVILAGVTPLPYKLCTLTSGLLGLALIPFVIASLIGRAGQFFIVSVVLWWGGPKIEQHLRRWMEIIGWAVIALAVVAYLYFRHE